jgi:ribonucleoside-diphosphate reductase beta chain
MNGNFRPQVPNFFNPSAQDRLHKHKLILNEQNITDVSGMWNLNEISMPDVHDWYFDTAWSFLWRPEEINMSEDRTQFSELDNDLQFAVETVISFLQYLDSVVPTNDISLLMAFPNYEIRRTLMIHQFVEGGIHTYSYQYILKSIFGENNKKINEIYRRSFDYEPLAKRNQKVSQAFQDLLEILPYKLVGIVSQEQFERAVFRSMIQDYFIEGVVFYTGFNFFHILEVDYGILTGTNKNILLIRRDENTHIPLFAKILNIIREKGHYFNEDEVYEIADMSAQSDIEFYSEVVGDRIKGMSVENIKTYIKYLTDKRLKELGLKPIYNEKRNPFEYIEEVAFNETSEFRKAGIFETGNTDYQHATDVNLTEIDDIVDLED